MTWTLHLYDDSGTEIGWATLDPHEFWVDPELPQYESSFISGMLGSMGNDTVYESETRWVAIDGAYVPEFSTVAHDTERSVYDRLDGCATNLVYEGVVSDYELADE